MFSSALYTQVKLLDKLPADFILNNFLRNHTYNEDTYKLKIDLILSQGFDLITKTV